MSSHSVDDYVMLAQIDDIASYLSSVDENDIDFARTKPGPLTTGLNPASQTERERERTFLCPEPGCDGRFHRKFTLREHLKTHTGEKPYQCAVQSCGKLFSTSGNLSRHRRLHMLTRIKCPILDCARVFTKQEKLLRHLKVHMGSAAHACNYPGCVKTFSTSGNLSRHIRTQHRGESRTVNRSTSVMINQNFPSTGGSPFQPLVMPVLTLPAKTDFYEATPIDVYSLGSHYQQRHLLPQVFEAGSHQQELISDSDVMLLLDCLFVNDASRVVANPSASHVSRGFQQHHYTLPQDAFEVYF